MKSNDSDRVAAPSAVRDPNRKGSKFDRMAGLTLRRSGLTWTERYGFYDGKGHN